MNSCSICIHRHYSRIQCPMPLVLEYLIFLCCCCCCCWVRQHTIRICRQRVEVVIRMERMSGNKAMQIYRICWNLVRFSENWQKLLNMSITYLHLKSEQTFGFIRQPIWKKIWEHGWRIALIITSTEFDHVQWEADVFEIDIWIYYERKLPQANRNIISNDFD